MELLNYIGVSIIISLIFISINGMYRDKNLELQIKLSNLKKEYDELYKEKIDKLNKENNELKKYKTLYELEVSNHKKTK